MARRGSSPKRLRLFPTPCGAADKGDILSRERISPLDPQESREARVTFARRQTAYRMRHCCARRIDGYLGRRKLLRTSARWAERHPQGVCRIRKAAEPPTAAQQRVVGAEANRIAASNAAPPRYGQCNRQALQLFELPVCNGNFLWEGEREGYLFSKKRYPSLSRAPCTVQGTKGPPAFAGGPFLSPFGKSGVS